MENKIKELRVKIDGLSQLVKGLKPQQLFRLDISAIPDGFTLEDHVRIFREQGLSIEDGSKGIEVIPQVYKEISHCYDSLILAKAWLGKVLEGLGEETPYKNNGNRKSIEDIEETADKYEAIAGLRKPFTNENNKENIAKPIDTWELNGRSMTDYSNMNHIEKVDWIREEIKEITFKTSDLLEYLYKEESHMIIVKVLYAYKQLSEARFWLGFELARCKKEYDEK